MTPQHYDLIVIGSGPAGHHAAIQGAKLGKSVAIIERQECVGGVCINTGTIPSKTLREAVLYLSGFNQRALYGSAYRVKEKITLQDLMFRCRHAVQKETDVYRLQFKRNGIDILTGTAQFVDQFTVHVLGFGEEADYTAGRFVIATGTVPARSPDFPVDGETIIDADGILGLKEIPKSLIVVGAGVIGLEYACMFSTVGTRVTIMDAKSRLLDFVDGELVEALTYHLRDNGVTMRLGESVARVEKGDGCVIAHTKSNKCLRSEALLYAIGRQGNTSDLHLEAAGLSADGRGRIAVDDHFRTEAEHIYAAGDVIGFPSLASTSMEQGRLACANAFGLKARAMPANFPYGLYTIPEISFVGKTEEQLTEEAVPYEVGIAHYREIARGEIIGDESGRLKLIFHRDTEELLGVHIFGQGATELVHIGQAVMALSGTVRYFIDNVFNYPTLAECYKVAALEGINKAGRVYLPDDVAEIA